MCCFKPLLVVNDFPHTSQNLVKTKAFLVQIRNICPLSFLLSVLTNSSSSQYLGPTPGKPWLLTAVGRTVIIVQTAPYCHISLPKFFTRIAIMKRKVHSRSPFSVNNIQINCLLSPYCQISSKAFRSLRSLRLEGAQVLDHPVQCKRKVSPLCIYCCS